MSVDEVFDAVELWLSLSLDNVPAEVLHGQLPVRPRLLNLGRPSRVGTEALDGASSVRKAQIGLIKSRHAAVHVRLLCENVRQYFGLDLVRGQREQLRRLRRIIVDFLGRFLLALRS